MLLLAAVLAPLVPAPASAQLGVAGEVVSSYVWRGLELNDDINVQPDIWFESGNLAFGAWSSWSFDGDNSEIDLYVSLYHELPIGELNLSVTDYFYPSAEGDFGDFTNFGGAEDGEATGAHTIELGAEFTPNSIPVTFMLGWNAWNDPDKALYGQAGTDLSLGGVLDLHGEAGFLLKDSEYYYGGEMGDLTHLGLTLSRSFTLGSHEPYVSAGFIRSELMEENYWVFALGF